MKQGPSFYLCAPCDCRREVKPTEVPRVFLCAVCGAKIDMRPKQMKSPMLTARRTQRER
jgi:hypothetical protein